MCRLRPRNFLHFLLREKVFAVHGAALLRLKHLLRRFVNIALLKIKRQTIGHLWMSPPILQPVFAIQRRFSLRPPRSRLQGILYHRLPQVPNNIIGPSLVVSTLFQNISIQLPVQLRIGNMFPCLGNDIALLQMEFLAFAWHVKAVHHSQFLFLHVNELLFISGQLVLINKQRRSRFLNPRLRSLD